MRLNNIHVNGVSKKIIYAVFCETCNKNLCAICNHSLHHKGMSELHVTRVDNTQIMKSSNSTLRTTNNGPWLDIEVK